MKPKLKLNETMKNDLNHIEEKINQTLNSLDGLKPAEPKPYLFARLDMKLAAKSLEPFSFKEFISGFKWQVAFAVFLIAINLVTVFSFLQTGNASTVSTQLNRTEKLSLILESYNLNPTDSNASSK